MKNKTSLFLLALFSLFIIYGTTIPFDFSSFSHAHQKIHTISLNPIADILQHRTSYSDVIQNILLFIPVGFLGGIFLNNLKLSIFNIIIVTTYGTLLSAFVESLQLFSFSRTTSLTDVITNTTGTFIGYILSVFAFTLARYFPAKSLFKNHAPCELLIRLSLILAIIIITFFQPFDFALKLSTMYYKVEGILNQPFHFSFSPHDDIWAITINATFGYLLLQFLSFQSSFRSKLSFLLFSLILPCLLSSFQFIITSRVPTVFNIFIATSGILFGMLIYTLFKNRQNLIRSLLFIGFTISLFCNLYDPFILNHTRTPMNILPFISEYEYTTMTSLGNIIENTTYFSFFGFLIYPYLYRKRKAFIITCIILFILIAYMEFMQGWIKDRYPDITDILIGYSSFFIGIYFWRKMKNFCETHSMQT